MVAAARRRPSSSHEHTHHTHDIPEIRRLQRSRSDRKVAGVSGGLARYFEIHPAVFRVGFVVLTLLGGAGILIYAAAALVMPDEGKEDSIATAALRNRRDRPWPLIGLGLLAVAGAVLLSRVTLWPERRRLVPLPDRGCRDPLDHAPARGRRPTLDHATATAGGARRSEDSRRVRRARTVASRSRSRRSSPSCSSPPPPSSPCSTSHLGRGVGDRDVRGHERREPAEQTTGSASARSTSISASCSCPVGETHVDASVDVGDLRVIVPAGVALQAHGTAEVGEVDLPGGVGGRRPQRRERRGRDRAARARARRPRRPGLGHGSNAPYDEPACRCPRFAPSSDERVIAGVCAGIAQTLAVDVTLVRLVFALLALAGGAGIVLYLALWAYSRTARALGRGRAGPRRGRRCCSAPSASPTGRWSGSP